MRMMKCLATRISTHAPRAGRDLGVSLNFLSFSDFNSRAPRGARLFASMGAALYADFNSRATRGARLLQAVECRSGLQFQLTRPARGATDGRPLCGLAVVISTHAPRAGRDLCCRRCWTYQKNFNSRGPRGGRLLSAAGCRRCISFQLTRPARGATADDRHVKDLLGISTHAPRAGRDGTVTLTEQDLGDFNSRAPRGARLTLSFTYLYLSMNFNSRAPRGARHLRWW